MKISNIYKDSLIYIKFHKNNLVSEKYPRQIELHNFHYFLEWLVKIYQQVYYV